MPAQKQYSGALPRVGVFCLFFVFVLYFVLDCVLTGDFVTKPTPLFWIMHDYVQGFLSNKIETKENATIKMPEE